MRPAWAARVWLVIGNTTALLFTIGVAAFHLLCLTELPEDIGLFEVGKNTHRFFLPVIVAATATSTVHLIVIIYSLFPTCRLLTCWRVRNARVAPPGAGVVPAPCEGNSDKFAFSETPPSSAWSRREAKLTRWFMLQVSSHSNELTRLLKLWEITLQTFQAYKISYLVASVPINRVIALVIVTNCWFSQLLNYGMGTRSMVHVELGRLILDSGLDLIYNVLIPLSIFYPYIRDFDGFVRLYPLAFYYDDIWYVNAVSESQQIFIRSWLDLISKTSGWLFLVYRLWNVKTAIDDVCVAAKVAEIRHTFPAEIHESKRLSNPSLSRLSRFLDFLLILWGATILSLHLTASISSFQSHDFNCLLQMRPWGSLAYSCASFEISCSKHRITGGHEAVEAILTQVDPLSVQNLILSNCPELHVPTVIQRLQFLTMIKVYNSTVVSWDTQAALRQAHHPQLQMIYFARVNFSEFPKGLLAEDFPSYVWDIEFCITNVSTFPPAITAAWTNVAVVSLEGNPDVTEYPVVLSTLPNVFTVILSMNSIAALEDAVSKQYALILLDMNGNPVEQLPDRIGVIDQLQTLNFVGTKIAEIPSAWMDIPVPLSKPNGFTVLHAAKSPLCESTEAQAIVKPSWLSVNCEIPPDGLYSYPVHKEDAWRRANQ